MVLMLLKLAQSLPGLLSALLPLILRLSGGVKDDETKQALDGLKDAGSSEERKQKLIELRKSLRDRKPPSVVRDVISKADILP